MAKFKKGKAKSGTWFSAEMANSQAFWALSGTASAMLMRFLMFRDIGKNHICTNCDDLTMTYKSLEGLFGDQIVPGEDGKRQYDDNGVLITKPMGIARSTIMRGFDDLLAKGFIKVIFRGGKIEHDKNIYGLVEDWKFWEKGKVFRVREKGNASGYNSLRKHHGRN